MTENNPGVVIDTQGSAPADGGTAQPEQTAKQTTEVNSVADAFASAKSEQEGGDTRQTDTASTATDQEPTKVDSEPKRFKYKTLEEAEKANKEAARKITELTEELARFKKGEPAETKPDTQDNGQDGDGGDDDMPELSDEEYSELARTDPLAARRYDQLMFEKKLETKLKPLTEKAQAEAAAAQEALELAHFDKVESSYDSEYGKGTFEKLQAQISNPESLKALVESSPVVAKALANLYKSGDRVATVEFLIREAHLFNQRTAESKQRRSVPSGNGSGVSTRPNTKVSDMASAFAAAKNENR